MARGAVVVLVAATALPRLLPEHPQIGLLANFPPFYAALALLAALFLLLRRAHWPWTVLALLVAAANALPVAALWRDPAPVQLQRPQPLRALFANVCWWREQSPALFDCLRDEDPDVAAFAEVRPHYAQDFGPLKGRLPYAFEHFELENTGLALYARWPLAEQQVLDLGDGIPALSARLQLPGRSLRVIVAHPQAPVRGPQRNREQMQALLAQVRDEPDLLLLGDLNCTPWSSSFRALLEDGGLHNARQGFGIRPSWTPLGLPLPPVLPIDHVLYKGRARVLDFRVGPRNRSDHRPVIADLEFETGLG